MWSPATSPPRSLVSAHRLTCDHQAAMAWRDWIRTVEIEPSLYAADFARLGEEVEILVGAGCRVFHFDVGDGSGDADIVLCMSIHPGYSGQEFMPEAVDRIARLRAALPEHVHIQVDGGIDNDTILLARDAGATLFVAGSAIFDREDLPRA